MLIFIVIVKQKLSYFFKHRTVILQLFKLMFVFVFNLQLIVKSRSRWSLIEIFAFKQIERADSPF